MNVDDRILNIIEDHALVTQFLGQLYCALKDERVAFPNFVPFLNDSIVTDYLGVIAEALRGRIEDE